MGIDDERWNGKTVNVGGGLHSQFVVASLTARGAIILVFAKTRLHYQMTVAKLVLAFTIFCNKKKNV